MSSKTEAAVSAADTTNTSFKRFTNVLQFLCCRSVEDDQLLPVNNDSALNRLAGQLQPGEVLSSVPVYKLPLTDVSGAQDNSKTKSKRVRNPADQKTKPNVLSDGFETISELHPDQDVATSSGNFTAKDLEGPTTSDGWRDQAGELQDFLDQNSFKVQEPRIALSASVHVSFSGQMMVSANNTQYKVLTMSLQLAQPLVISSQLRALDEETNPHTTSSDCDVFATANSSRTSITDE